MSKLTETVIGIRVNKNLIHVSSSFLTMLVKTLENVEEIIEDKTEIWINVIPPSNQFKKPNLPIEYLPSFSIQCCMKILNNTNRNPKRGLYVSH